MPRRKFNYEKPNFIPFTDVPKQGMVVGQSRAANRVAIRLASDYGPMCGWIYTRIFAHADNNTHRAKFTQAVLSRETGCDESTLRDYIGLLCDIGYITLIKRGFSLGQHQEPSEYEINDADPATGYLVNEDKPQFPKYDRAPKQNNRLHDLAMAFISTDEQLELKKICELAIPNDKPPVYQDDDKQAFVDAIRSVCKDIKEQEWKLKYVGLALFVR